MIIATVSLKGGAGKTTIAVNLAVELANEGAKVILIDADPNNQNALTWSGLRPENKPQVTTFSLPDPGALRNSIHDISSNCDIVIIDGTPALEKLTGTIMLVSDLVILPLRASDYDMWAFSKHFLPKLEDIRSIKPELDCRILRNAANEKELIDREVQEILQEYELPTMKTIIGDRTIFKRTPRTGLGVTEMKEPQAIKARFDIQSLAKEINQILTSKLTEA
jgi:chromosome partitioning protein